MMWTRWTRCSGPNSTRSRVPTTSRCRFHEGCMALQQVEVGPVAPERLTPLIGEERGAEFAQLATAARALLAGRKVVNINSTATGGGVAELLQTLLAYGR